MAPLDRARLLSYRIPDAHEDYDPRDVITYALGVGAGLTPDIDELSFLYERGLQALPTMALVLGTPGFWPMAPQAGLDWIGILHGEQRLQLHAPLDVAGSLVGRTKIDDLADKGSGKAALIRATKRLTTLSGELVATATETWVARGAGGFGGARDLPGPALPEMPLRAPDSSIELRTCATQAAIYRLSGDRNPLHIDPSTAQQAGFARPILHGLSSMGAAARAIIHACCDGAASRLVEIGVRFTSPVYPGETLRTQIWRDGDQVRFRVETAENRIVIDNGDARLNG